MAKVKIVTTGIDKDRIKAAAIKAIGDNAQLEIQIQAKRKFWNRMFGKFVKIVIEGIVQELLNQCGMGKIHFTIKFV
jgi:hypothetical protein